MFRKNGEGESRIKRTRKTKKTEYLKVSSRTIHSSKCHDNKGQIEEQKESEGYLRYPECILATCILHSLSWKGPF